MTCEQTTVKSAPDATKTPTDEPTGRQYWLMKAEPETRIEKGQDIKFSIDDLAGKTVPEPWDGKSSLSRCPRMQKLIFTRHSSVSR